MFEQTKTEIAQYKSKLIQQLKVLRHKLFIFSLVMLPVMGMTFYGTYKVNKFFDEYKLVFRSPIQSPILVVKRGTSYEAQAEELPLWKKYGFIGIEKDICIRFGTECLTAVAVSKAENRDHKCDVINKNKNKTEDIGLFQMNTLHFEKYSRRDLLDCQINLNAAWELYQDSGWGAWVTYNNGYYKQFLSK